MQRVPGVDGFEKLGQFQRRGSGGILEIPTAEFAIVEVARVTQTTGDAQAGSIRVRRTIGLDPPQPDSTVYELASALPDCPRANQPSVLLFNVGVELCQVCEGGILLSPNVKFRNKFSD